MNSRGCLWAIIKTLLILSVFGGFLTVAAFPWVIPMPGRGSLDGSWIGEVRSNSGPRAWLLLSLQPSRDSTPRISAVLTGGGTPLGGSAVLCTAGFRFELFVSGDTMCGAASKSTSCCGPCSRALRTSASKSSETGTDTLGPHTENVSLADLERIGIEGTQPESARFVSAQLRKGTPAEFDSACRTLTRGS